MEEEKSLLPTPVEEFGVGKFEIKNFDKLKSALTVALKKYEAIEVTDEFYIEAKNIRAELNKVSKALDDRRKELKKKYLEPFEYGEAQIKDLTDMIGSVSRKIDDGIKAIEDKRRTQKKEEIVALFEAIENPHDIKLEAVWNDSWLNAGTSMKKITEEITTFFAKVNEDLSMVDNLFESNPKRGAEVKKFYLENGYVLNEAIKKEKELYDYTHRPAPTPVAAEEPKEEIPESIPTSEPVEEVKVESINFRVYGTREELLALGNYIKEHGLKYETLGR